MSSLHQQKKQKKIFCTNAEELQVKSVNTSSDLSFETQETTVLQHSMGDSSPAEVLVSNPASGLKYLIIINTVFMITIYVHTTVTVYTVSNNQFSVAL